jgi:hypothetical protein
MPIEGTMASRPLAGGLGLPAMVLFILFFAGCAPRQAATQGAPPAASPPKTELLQMQGDDIHKFEIVPGIKVNPYKDLVFGFNAIVPLNREGLTTDWTPNGTAEVSYHF